MQQKKSQKVFVHVPSEMASHEVEEIGMFGREKQVFWVIFTTTALTIALGLLFCVGYLFASD